MPRRTIDQFMWGYQSLFCRSLEFAVGEAFRGAGVATEADAFLVGFRVEGTEGRWSICVEPESGPYVPDHLSEAVRRAQELYEANPERAVWNSDPGVHANRQRWLLDSARAEAIEALLEDLDSGFDFRVGNSTRVGDFEVHPVIRLTVWRALPRLETQIKERMTVTRSLPDGILQEVFRRCSLALERPNPGSDLDVLEGTSRDLWFAAADRLCGSAALLSGQFLGSGLMDAISVLSNTLYEGRSAEGELVLARRDHPAIEIDLDFQVPIPMNNERALRKAFELAHEGLYLLSDARDAYGVGRIRAEYDSTAEDLFIVRVSAAGTWQLKHDALPLLDMRHGKATVPTERLSRAVFDDLASRLLLPHVPSKGLDAAALWEVLATATLQIKGAMMSCP